MNEIDEVASKKELAELRAKLGMGMLIPISKEEAEQYKTMKTLPEDVYEEISELNNDPTGRYLRYSSNAELSDEEKDEFLKLQFLLQMRSVEKGVNILSGIAIAGVILAIFAFIYFLIQFAQLSSLFH